MTRPRSRGVRTTPMIALLLCAAMISGCISIDVSGGGRGEMRETLVQGDKGPKVLLLDIDGEITDSDAAGVLGWVLSEGTVARVKDELDLAEENDDIEAILLRIDSPGGSPTASDAVFDQLTRFKTRHGVPIYAQLMSTAASGGYYIAMSADRIAAMPTTVTGSIGVIMLGINLAGLMDKVGVENQTITSGAFKDTGSFLRPMRPDERAQLQSVIDDLYDRFVAVVKIGRPALTAERVRELADGRIYSAPQALEAGLIDQVADLEQTIAAIGDKLGSKQVRVVSYHRKQQGPSNIFSRSSVRAPVEIEPDATARLWPRPGFYYLWWPATQ